MRTVLTIDRTGEIDPTFQTEKLLVKIERNPANVPGMTFTRPLELSPAQLPAWSMTNAVVERGRLLRAALRKHAAIASILDDLGKDPDGSVHPIYVKLNQSDAESITWEALCDANDAFVALDRRWPIGRITDPAETEPRNPPLFTLPVRVLAVISALGIQGQIREWQYLRDAVRDARNAGLGIQLRVIVGDAAVYSAIEQEIQAHPPGWAELGSVPEDGNVLVRAIKSWQPQILHFFCHGVAEGSTQRLEFAAALDYQDTTTKRGSALVDAGQLIALSNGLTNPWLATFNCCEGAQASEELTSLAHQAVSAAFPAAVAMLEPIDAKDAHEFTRAFYAELFSELLAVGQGSGANAPFEWARLMREVRITLNKLHDEDASNRREWALPALYVRGVDPMGFVRLAPGELATDATEHRRTASFVAKWLRTVRESMPLAARVDVMQEMLGSVPQKYWPDPDGELPT
jgi:hypothetical protein